MKPKLAKPQPCSDAGEEPLNQKPKNKPRVRTAKRVVAPGDVFGRLTVTQVLPCRKGKRYVEALCVCGSYWEGLVTHLRSGATASCGCLFRDTRRDIRLKHGHSADGKVSRLHRAWQNMKSRCYRNAPINHQYKARGIEVCVEWRDNFEAFADYLGPPPSSAHSVDRIDNSKNYEPGNVRWATKKEQGNNKASNVWLTAFGRTQTVAQWGAFLSVKRNLIPDRLKRGWSLEAALTQPLHTRKAKERKQY